MTDNLNLKPGPITWVRAGLTDVQKAHITGIIASGTLYLAMVLMAALWTQHQLAMFLAIATAGAAYIQHSLSLLGVSQAVEAAMVIGTIVLGIAAGLALFL